MLVFENYPAEETADTMPQAGCGGDHIDLWLSERHKSSKVSRNSVQLRVKNQEYDYEIL